MRKNGEFDLIVKTVVAIGGNSVLGASIFLPIKHQASLQALLLGLMVALAV